MKTFNSLDINFRRAFKQAAKQGTVNSRSKELKTILIQSIRCLKFRIIMSLTIPCRDKRVFV